MGAWGEPLSAEALSAALAQVAKTCRRALKPAHLHDWLDFLQECDDLRFLGGEPDRLSARDFGYYFSESGGARPESEIAWFLPRMCEIMAGGETLTPDFGWIESFCFLRLSRFPTAWPEDRASAMTAFCDALIADFVVAPDRYADALPLDRPTLGTMLCAMTKEGVSPTALLDAVEACPKDCVHAACDAWLANDVLCRDPSTGKIDLSADVYWRQNTATETVTAWLTQRGWS